MVEKFSPSWISCLDESMSKWLGQYMCPGFMCVPRKPWPYGNEYHTIACRESQIIYNADLVEGKDEPRQCPQKKLSLEKQLAVCSDCQSHFFTQARLLFLILGFVFLVGLLKCESMACLVKP